MDKSGDQVPCNGDQHETDPVDMDEETAAKEKLTSGDPNKVKFTSVNLAGYDGKNGEAKVDILVTQTTVGMGKEELLKYANEPFWVRLRMFLFVFFWVAWIAMLVGAIAIIILAPRCPDAPRLDWYQQTCMYQIDVETFKDSDGDGIGDLQGLISKLDYFKNNNIGTLMLSAFYKSSTDTEAIVEHKEVDSKFGTLADFEELMIQMKNKDLKLVVDFNPNHSSAEHPWFTASVEGQEPYKDFYIWADAKENKPPNNWLDVSGESAWTWNGRRQQYYFHTFGVNKPELNLENELVQQELRDIITFWLEKGVDGFKVIAASHLVEEILKDEPLAVKEGKNSPEYKELEHVFTVDHPKNLNLFEDWTDLLKNFTDSTKISKIFIAEVSGSLNGSILYYGNETYTLPILTHLTQMNEKSTGIELKEHLERRNRTLPANAWPTLLVGNKKVRRLASRVGVDLIDGIHMVAFLANGTPITYYGDELGITDLATEEASADKLHRPQTVMLWNNETYAGFTNGSSPLHVHPNYHTVNVQMQENDKQSHLMIYSRLLALKGQPALDFGLQNYPIVTDDIFSMIRVRKGSPGYLVVVNLGSNSTTVDFTGTSQYLPEGARVEIRSRNVKTGSLAEGDHPKISLNNVPLDAKQAAVFSFVPLFEG